MPPITKRSYARIGLLGNPSDGYNGKTISLLISNFHAEVTLRPHVQVCFEPHPTLDMLQFDTLDSLAHTCPRNGYCGGVRLLQACCKRFFDHMELKDHKLPSKGFTLSYTTNIPRQSGLSGSSAIVCAALNCLIEYFGVENLLPLEERPKLLLSVEQDELGITAGLQDRVIQVLGGMVYMDFGKKHKLGFDAKYVQSEIIDSKLWLVYADNPSDSGKLHSTVRQRYNNGDEDVQRLIGEIAECAEQGLAAIEDRDLGKLHALMNRNFDLRLRLFGADCLGELNLQMIETARSSGASAKFCGSGGAAVCLCRNANEEDRLKTACEGAGFVVVPITLQPKQFES
mmetsp:Transcript_8756/g.32304  ORF Transcript_8756/g.32304 Transcript_8756/m.32304 type:complete len:342 (-) Transcript_8756:1633-2658(-)